ncbi:hypothetical protein [Pleurocapsa sp. FMAR1]|uniref:hypothetical protein n=1 Tax=Pleurocapsa sp. FMAR1 TaxID=3040204 RepID=UPI0029C7AF4D|nr:hypothetical protein [Pleurocapsa sp. FMAR1]
MNALLIRGKSTGRSRKLNDEIERLWKEIKKHLKWELFDNLDRLRQKRSRV